MHNIVCSKEKTHMVTSDQRTECFYEYVLYIRGWGRMEDIWRIFLHIFYVPSVDVKTVHIYFSHWHERATWNRMKNWKINKWFVSISPARYCIHFRKVLLILVTADHFAFRTNGGLFLAFSSSWKMGCGLVKLTQQSARATCPNSHLLSTVFCSNTSHY